MGGSLGEISAASIITWRIYMLFEKVITWHIPVSIFGTVAVFTGIFWLIKSRIKYADPVFHLLTGGVMLGCNFYGY